MSEYWSQRFTQEGMIWGSEPSPTALLARDIFRRHQLKSVLVPGAGYGRNTKVFSEEFQTYGIELSQAALEMAVDWDPMSCFIAGSALDYRLDKQVDAVYCYDVLHLFLEEDRRRLIANCLEQLRPGGLLFFTSFSDEDSNFGCGRFLEPGTYEYKEGKFAHFFSEADLREHFAGTEILDTGSQLETLRSPQGATHTYILRTIIARRAL
ncbi:class I SAM-dependent methyltransferase [Paenibacillus monticola]|uniref:Methyltransferase domain-containing protein n=1 Tax=Paenibacillus monticola TaxID=2666075 RepID=A0A7X2H3F1_9BACL|nr:class I SAM-dependent methyltransferase [Paenibacillus monticola]MRN52847.1 methyltransferase domain-containing protein [Paenibacillus monticola]